MTGPRDDAEVWKTGGLLIAILIHNLIYPITQQGIAGNVLFYAFYGSMYAVAVWLMSGSAVLRALVVATGAAVFVAGVGNAATGVPGWALAVFVFSVLYHFVTIWALVRYTVAAREVFTEIILAATALYLVIGSAFAAIFAVIEFVQPGSFMGADGPVHSWQQLLYFSYVTLTSLGFGDILPVRFYAQAFTAFEAIVGVLYTVILLSRLVGMHTAKRAS